MRTMLLAAGLLAVSGCEQHQGVVANNADKSQPTAGKAFMPWERQEPATDPIPQTVGRFVIVHSPQVERDTVLLDTATGKTWVATEETYLKGDPVVWLPMPQLNTSAETEHFDAAHEPKTDKTTGWAKPVRL